MIDDIYNKDVLRLAATITRIGKLEDPDASVSLRSPLCGSAIEVELKLADGKVADYAHTIKACALGQASASVMAKAVVGKTADDIRAAWASVEKMLVDGGDPPSDDWSALSALAPAKDAKPRHGAILLPFDAVLKGMEERT
jgi:NifU-like protein involved in Fe-S cluster formation